MLAPWLNTQVKIQRRDPLAARNPLNEPGYGDDSTYPTAYNLLWVRIEYDKLNLQFTATGERIAPAPNQVLMFVEGGYYIQEEDRVIVEATDDPTLIGKQYIISDVHPEWDGMGNVHHYLCDLTVH